MFVPDVAVVELADGSSVDLESLTVEELDATLADLSQAITRLEAARVAVVAAVARRGDWQSTGARSVAHFVSWRTGAAGVEARRLARLADRLPSTPLVAHAFAEGTVSAAKADLAVTVATPDNEADLVEWATSMSGPQFQRTCRGLRRVVSSLDSSGQPLPDPADAPSRFGWTWTDERRLRVHGDLRADDGALFISALDAARNHVAAERTDAADAPAGEPAQVEPDVRNGEAFVRLAESGLAGRFRVGSGADRHQVIVVLDASALDGSAPARFSDGTAVPPAALERILCDTSVVGALVEGSEPLAIGRKDRDPTPAQRRAVRVRDRWRCRFPGCDATRHVEIHHVQHWSRGGPTDVDNLLSLCWHHHHALHGGHWTIEAPTSRARSDSGDWDYRHRGGRLVQPVAGDDVAAGAGSTRTWRLAPLSPRPRATGPPPHSGERLTEWGLDVVISSLLPRAA